jgi:hypothetical protein
MLFIRHEKAATRKEGGLEFVMVVSRLLGTRIES